MIRRPPRFTRTDTPFPYTTLFRSVIVPYKSSGESITALLGGHVDVVSASSPNVLAQYKAGTIRLLAVTTAERLPGQLSAVPTWKEQGIDAVSTSVQGVRSEEHTSELQSLMRSSYAVFCLKKT